MIIILFIIVISYNINSMCVLHMFHIFMFIISRSSSSIIIWITMIIISSSVGFNYCADQPGSQASSETKRFRAKPWVSMLASSLIVIIINHNEL